MKTAEEYLKIWQGEEVVISEDIAIVAMKEYAKQVAEQALKDAASGCQYVACINEYVNEKSCIESTPISTP